MRGLIIKLLVFGGIIEGLAYVNFMVLLSAIGVAIALVICSDLLLASTSPR